MKNSLFLIALLFLVACGNSDKVSDAFGTFEATEITVPAEVGGKLLTLNVEEGQVLKAGELVGVVDTIDWQLKIAQLRSQMSAIASKYPGVSSQIAVQQQQLKNLQTDRDRIEKLYRDGAATKKQVDDINGNIDLVQKQILSTQTQNASVGGELGALQAQLLQAEENLRRCRIVNPIDGTVLDKYCEAFEMATPGKALYKLADLSVLYLRVYVSGAQLPAIKLGQQVEVRVDQNEAENRSLKGEVCWISSAAEFTPKIIQTKEERVNLVYAVKVRVVNDGSLKIGQPGEVKFISE